MWKIWAYGKDCWKKNGKPSEKIDERYNAVTVSEPQSDEENNSDDYSGLEEAEAQEDVEMCVKYTK